MQHVKDIMTHHPKTCELHHPITCSLQLMKDEDCGAIPVVDKEHKVQGIITDRDIALCLLENQRLPKEIQVKDCIRLGQMITVKPEDPLHKAVDLMEKHQVRRIPVVDDQHKCIGIVSQADIILKDKDRKEVADMVEEIAKEKETIGARH